MPLTEQAPTTESPLLCLERHRDQLAARLEKLRTEPWHLVDGFEYQNPAHAAKTRGRLMCRVLRQIDAVNKEICRMIWPGFEPRPTEGFSDRVMRLVRTVP